MKPTNFTPCMDGMIPELENMHGTFQINCMQFWGVYVKSQIVHRYTCSSSNASNLFIGMLVILELWFFLFVQDVGRENQGQGYLG